MRKNLLTLLSLWVVQNALQCLEYVSVGKNNENNKRDKREASAEDDDSNSEEGGEDGESSESEGMTEVKLFKKSLKFLQGL